MCRVYKVCRSALHLSCRFLQDQAFLSKPPFDFILTLLYFKLEFGNQLTMYKKEILYFLLTKE